MPIPSFFRPFPLGNFIRPSSGKQGSVIMAFEETAPLVPKANKKVEESISKYDIGISVNQYITLFLLGSLQIARLTINRIDGVNEANSATANIIIDSLSMAIPLASTTVYKILKEYRDNSINQQAPRLNV